MRSHRNFICAAALIIIACGWSVALATPPANDHFINAQNLPTNNTLVQANNTEATKEAGEPFHAGNRGGKSVWFKYIPTASGVLTLTHGGGFDSLLGVYVGNSVGALALVGANDDNNTESGQATLSKLVLGVQAGVTYYIAVDGKYSPNNGNVGGAFFSLTYEFSGTPANDVWSANVVGLPRVSSQIPIVATNVNAGKEAGEPNHAGNAGGRSIWFRFASPSTANSYTFTVKATLVSDPTTPVSTLLAAYQGNTLASLTPVTSAIATGSNAAHITISMPVSTTYYIALDSYNSGGGAAAANFQLTSTGTETRRHPDFDQDGRTDITVFRPSTGVWYTLDSVTGSLRSFTWGQSGDVPLVNHWDGDERPDYSVFRPSTNVWHLLKSSSNAYDASSWGAAGDVPFAINQFKNGISSTYRATFRPSTGTWFINGPQTISYQFGQNGDIPLIADFDGDGTDEVVVFRPSNGVWYIGHPFDNAPYSYSQFGLAGDRPVPADYDADGKSDLAVFRPSTGTWYILRSSNATLRVVTFGESTDIPQPADFDNFGLDEVAVFRPSTGVWYIQPEFGPSRSVQFGQAGDIPVSAPIFGGN